MKKIVLLILIIVLFGSCNKNYLDKPPGVDLTENDIFKNKAGVESFLSTIYGYAVPPMFMYEYVANLSTTNPTGAFWQIMQPLHILTDEADESFAGWMHGTRWNTANVTAENAVVTEDYRYYIRWTSLRQINIMLTKIDNVPEAEESYKSQIKGEMHTLRALNYLDMVKRYGGVPIADSIFEPGMPIDKPRNSLADCIDFIVKECDLAISNPNLPGKVSSDLTGRASKLLAYCIKQKALLFAASPIFNTATPYLDLGDNNELICYGNTDNNRWLLAANAAKNALDFAKENGYALIDVPANRDPQDVPGSGQPGPQGNYRDSWEINNNSEIIFGFQGRLVPQYENPLNNLIPVTFNGWTSSVSVPLNFFKKYEKKDGTVQTWDINGGDDLMAKYAELDPRFKQTMCYTNSYFVPDYPIAQIFNGGAHYNNCFGGVWLRKYLPRNTAWSAIKLNDVYFRLNELYLDYAEALNESSVNPPVEAYNSVNAIRARSAMPALPQGLSKAQFRDRLRNERAIELAYDNQRFFDIRRWLIAEEDGVMQGDFWGLQINKQSDSKFSWKPYVFEKRSFLKKMYLHPFPLNEVLKGNLVQNPGY